MNRPPTGANHTSTGLTTDRTNMTRVTANQPASDAPRQPHPPRELLLADDVADFLGMGKDWVYDQTRKGRIPRIKLGRSYRYRRQAINTWLEQQEHDAA
jgi:excisionase family DNA binding protein